VNILGKYYDGLEVSVSGRPRMPVLKRLREEKRALRASSHRLRDVGPVPGVSGEPLMLTRKGEGYHFILQTAAIKRLELAGWRKSSQVMIQFRAKPLHEIPLEEVKVLVDKIASYFLEGAFKVLVGRFDVAVDVQFPGGKMPERKDIITRLRGHAFDVSPELITGMKFGSDKGPLQIELYNKSREIKVHRENAWIKAHWTTSASYDEGLDVHRVEIRFFREFLQEFTREDPLTGEVRGIDTISDVISSSGDLLGYVLGGDGGKGSKFRIASPDSRHLKPDLRRSSPQWEVIRKAFLEDTLRAGRVRTRAPSSIPDLKTARSTAMTYLVQAAAWECVLHGHPPKPAEEYLGPSLLQELPQWLKRKGHGSWEQAVNLQVKSLLSDGKVPWA
jgi:hypothetical protein